jgi:hypothetical protein
MLFYHYLIKTAVDIFSSIFLEAENSFPIVYNTFLELDSYYFYIILII